MSDRVSGAPATAQRLLPNEPRIIDHDVQSELTERLLLPALVQLKAFFLAARTHVDADLCAAKPLKDGKPYPLGQCLEISCAVEMRLPSFVAMPLDADAAQGHAAFSAFLHAGGTFRLVWGDLRGEFFQNAFQLGTLYVDVANDTVTVTKPKVEILPFAEAGFLPIADFRHFGRIAARYWQHDVYPNHVLPTLAPYFPLIHIARMGTVSIRPANEYMLALTMAGRFRPSEDMLRDPAMPEDLFDHVARALAGTGLTIPASPDDGRSQALHACTDYREKRWHASSRQTETFISAALDANRRLTIAGHVRPQSVTDRSMPFSATQDRPHPPIDGYDVVSKASHARQRWFPTVGYRFAAGDTVCRLIAQELPMAAQKLPVGFVREGDGFALVAILGLETGNNLYVDADGRWLSGHIPALYRSHPFRMARAADGKSMLCVDTDSCVTSRTKGHAFFADDGQAGAAVTDIVKFLGQVSANLRSTERACAALQVQDLIEPWPIHIGVKAIQGFFRIDETRLKQLDADALCALDQAGAFAIARAQLLSMRNLPALADLAGLRAKPDNQWRRHGSGRPDVHGPAGLNDQGCLPATSVYQGSSGNGHP